MASAASASTGEQRSMSTVGSEAALRALTRDDNTTGQHRHRPAPARKRAGPISCQSGSACPQMMRRSCPFRGLLRAACVVARTGDYGTLARKHTADGGLHFCCTELRQWIFMNPRLHWKNSGRHPASAHSHGPTLKAVKCPSTGIPTYITHPQYVVCCKRCGFTLTHLTLECCGRLAR